jgi:hypothetical protein
MFLKVVASSKYANIVTILCSNVDPYRHPNDEYFLPQNFQLTNIAMLIHNHTKARVRDLGNHRINRVAGWDSMSDVLADDKLQFCHIQGYQPRVLHMEQGCDQGPGGRGPDRRVFDMRQGYDHQQDHSTVSSNSSSTSSTLSSKRGSVTPRGSFARMDQHRCSFLPDKQCDAYKHIGHEAINCNMLALALFIEHHKQSLLDSERNEIESKWLAHWKECLGQPARTPRQVMHTYCDVMSVTTDTLNLAMDWECWPELDVTLAVK